MISIEFIRKGLFKICALIVALLAICMDGRADGHAIRLFLSNGTSQIFKLDDVPTAKFVGKTVVISDGTKEVSVFLEDTPVVKFEYIDMPNAVEELNTETRPIFHVNALGVEVSGLKPHSSLFLYKANGTLLERSFADDSGYARVPINSHGIFIVKVSNSSFKIKK